MASLSVSDITDTILDLEIFHTVQYVLKLEYLHEYNTWKQQSNQVTQSNHTTCKKIRASMLPSGCQKEVWKHTSQNPLPACNPGKFCQWRNLHEIRTEGRNTVEALVRVWASGILLTTRAPAMLVVSAIHKALDNSTSIPLPSVAHPSLR